VPLVGGRELVAAAAKQRDSGRDACLERR
jgi:hypothetical protein